MPIESQAPHATTGGAPRAEADFYRAYAWCLNPMLSLGDLFLRLREELERADGRPAGWQREETRVNLFLFVCGIACIVDDHLARRLYDLSPVVARFPRLRAPVAVAYRAAQRSAATDSADPSTPTTTSSCPPPSPLIAARLPGVLDTPRPSNPAGGVVYRANRPIDTSSHRQARSRSGPEPRPRAGAVPSSASGESWPLATSAAHQPEAGGFRR